MSTTPPHLRPPGSDEPDDWRDHQSADATGTNVPVNPDDEENARPHVRAAGQIFRKKVGSLARRLALLPVEEAAKEVGKAAIGKAISLVIATGAVTSPTPVMPPTPPAPTVPHIPSNTRPTAIPASYGQRIPEDPKPRSQSGTTHASE